VARILFDQGVPAPPRTLLPGHEIRTAFECGWQVLQNGELLAEAEAAGFDVMVTTDKNIRYQQNLTGRRIAILVLSTTNWRRIRQHGALVLQAVEAIGGAQFVELSIP